MKMRRFAVSVADDHGLLTEAEMNRLCYFGASIIPGQINKKTLYILDYPSIRTVYFFDKVHKKVQVRKSLLKI